MCANPHNFNRTSFHSDSCDIRDVYSTTKKHINTSQCPITKFFDSSLGLNLRAISVIVSILGLLHYSNLLLINAFVIHLT